MATVSIALGRARNFSASRESLPVLDCDATEETITTDATSKVTVLAATSDYEQIFEVTATGGNVRVEFGPAPTASTTIGFLVLDGQTRHFGAKSGYKAAVTNA